MLILRSIWLHDGLYLAGLLNNLWMVKAILSLYFNINNLYNIIMVGERAMYGAGAGGHLSLVIALQKMGIPIHNATLGAAWMGHRGLFESLSDNYCTQITEDIFLFASMHGWSATIQQSIHLGLKPIINREYTRKNHLSDGEIDQCRQQACKTSWQIMIDHLRAANKSIDSPCFCGHSLSDHKY